MDTLFLPLLAGSAVALASGLAMVLARRPVHAVVALLVHSLSLAGLYAILSAGLVAVGQLIIYSGAIVVLFLFVVTLLPTGSADLRASGGRRAAATMAGVVLLVALGLAAGRGVPRAVLVGESAVQQVGRALFGPLLVAFELTAPLLLVAIVSGVAIWRRFEPQPLGPRRPAETTARRVVLHQ